MTIHHKATLTGHRGAIFTLAKGEQPFHFYSGDGNGWLVRWDLRDTSKGKAIAKVPSNIFALCFLHQHDLLVVGSMQGILYFIDVQKSKVIPPTLELPSAIFDIQQHQDYLFIVAGDGILRRMKIGSSQIGLQLKVTTASLRSMTFHPSLSIMAIGASDHHIYIVNWVTWKVIQVLKYHQNSVFSVKFVNQGNALLSGSRDAHLTLWTAQENKTAPSHKTPYYELTHTQAAHLFTINNIVEGSSKKWLATASRDKSIKIWDAQTLKLLKVIDASKVDLSAHLNSVNKLLCLPDSNYLVSGSDDRTVKVWEINSQ